MGRDYRPPVTDSVSGSGIPGGAVVGDSIGAGPVLSGSGPGVTTDFLVGLSVSTGISDAQLTNPGIHAGSVYPPSQLPGPVLLGPARSLTWLGTWGFPSRLWVSCTGGWFPASAFPWPRVYGCLRATILGPPEPACEWFRVATASRQLRASPVHVRVSTWREWWSIFALWARWPAPVSGRPLWSVLGSLPTRGTFSLSSGIWFQPHGFHVM